MKSHLIQASTVCVVLVASSLASAQAPAFPGAPAVRESAQGRAPDSAIKNGTGQPGSLSGSPAGVPAGKVEAASGVAAGTAKPATPPPSAQPAVSATSSNPTAAGPGERTVNPKAKELEALQQEIPLWKAKAEIAKYRAEVTKAEQSMGGALSAPLPGTGAQQIMQAPALNLVPVRTAPSVDKGDADGLRLVTLRAFDGQFDAIVDNGGNVITVRVGDPIGTWTVAAIDGSGVRLTNGKRVRTLRL